MNQMKTLVFEKKKRKRGKKHTKNSCFINFRLAKKVLSQLFFIRPGASPAQSQCMK